MLSLQLVAAGGCASDAALEPSHVLVEAAEVRPTWQSVLRPEDTVRLERVAEAWERGLTEARRAGFGRRLAAEGDLLDPDAAQPRGELPPGSYRCRILRLGGSGRRAFAAQGPHFCHVGVEGPLLSFTQQTGAPRPGGYLYDAGDDRLVFAGAAAGRREAVPPPYGVDPQRDVVGIIERVGSHRYRMIVPFPAGERSSLIVYELIPSLG